MKYEMIKDETTKGFLEEFYRIKSLIQIGDVPPGTLGGYIEKPSNLSQEGSCWVFEGGKISGNASIQGNARIYDAQIRGNVRVFGNVVVEKGLIADYCMLYDNARIINSHVFGNTVICGNSFIDTSHIHEWCSIQGNSQVLYSSISGHTLITENANIKSKLVRYGTVTNTLEGIVPCIRHAWNILPIKGVYTFFSIGIY